MLMRPVSQVSDVAHGLLFTLQTCQWRGLAWMAHLLFGMDRPPYHVSYPRFIFKKTKIK